MGKSGLRALALVGWMGVCLPCAHAGTINSLYVFGDSLSDVGNVFLATGGLTPTSPYVNGEFSNGPVAVQDLAAALGLGVLKPSLAGGTDYAYGSGETGPTSFNTSNLATDILGSTGQLAQFQATHPTADPNGLYVIWIGANDLADIAASGPTPTQTALDIATVVSNIDTTINLLAGEGAKNFLVLTVPDLGKTPNAAIGGVPEETALSALSGAFDSTLVNGSGPLPSLSTIATVDKLNLKVLDTYSLLDAITASPSTFGFSNVTDPCYNGVTVCSTPNKYLFFDGEHPTAAADAIVAADALAVINAPEPASITLVGAGLLGGAMLVRRRGKAMARRLD